METGNSAGEVIEKPAPKLAKASRITRSDPPTLRMGTVMDEVWHLYDDTYHTLERVRERRLKLAVVSNWDRRLPPSAGHWN